MKDEEARKRYYDIMNDIVRAREELKAMHARGQIDEEAVEVEDDLADVINRMSAALDTTIGG